MIQDDKVRKLIEWISENAWRESRALYPDPTWHVHAGDLLDVIRDTWGLREIDIQAIVDKSTKPGIQTSCEQPLEGGGYRFSIEDTFGHQVVCYHDDRDIAEARAYGTYFKLLLDSR